MRFIKSLFLVLGVLITSTTAYSADVQADRETSQPQITVTYYHTSARCPSCKKIEIYADKAITSGFPKELANKELIWTSRNIEEEENKAFIEKYSLFSQTLILSKTHNGEEVEWKNLDKVWQLVGSEEKFITYVQKEIANFLSPQKEQE